MCLWHRQLHRRAKTMFSVTMTVQSLLIENVMQDRLPWKTSSAHAVKKTEEYTQCYNLRFADNIGNIESMGTISNSSQQDSKAKHMNMAWKEARREAVPW